jgi:hypothetical protein
MSFMALPVELRESIYNYLLVTPALIEIEPRDLRPSPLQRKSSGRIGPEFHLKGIQDCYVQQRIDPTIMLVSKATHDEAKAFLYSRNTFEFDGLRTRPSFLEAFLEQIKSYRILLRHIKICYYLGTEDDEMHFLQDDIGDFRSLAANCPRVETVLLTLSLKDRTYRSTTTERRSNNFRAIDALLRTSGTIKDISLRCRYSYSSYSDLTIPRPALSDKEMEARAQLCQGVRALGWTAVQ